MTMNWSIDDIITTDKYLYAFQNNYYKTDIFYTNGSIQWRNRVLDIPRASIPFIVSGHSDFPLIESIVKRYPTTKWFAVNNQTSNVCGIPLGITNNTYESELHHIYGNTDIMVQTVNKPRNIINLVYMNFSVHTYPVERTKVWNMFKNKAWVSVEEPENSLYGRQRFLENARNHSFVLCPRGNGIDTHRLWETLYMGSIPIVIRDIAHSGWTDLPILFVDSWEEVSEERLQKELVRFQNTHWNMEKLLIRYWIQRIKNESRNHYDSN